MYTELVKAKLRQATQIITALAILFSGYLSGAYAQPMLNPEQTVNTATGEMGFSLPLETVNGINGTGFPISLNYGAGIRLHQEATPAGLGFSYGPGFITRKEIIVPDNGVGGIGNYTYFNDADKS